MSAGKYSIAFVGQNSAHIGSPPHWSHFLAAFAVRLKAILPKGQAITHILHPIHKSLTLEFPNENIFVDKNLIYDFIRGYCDGDGSLGVYDKENTKTTEINFVGTESFLLSLRKYLNIDGYIRNKSTSNYQNQAYSLQYSGVQARSVAKTLYENSSIYLERKYNIYKLFCQLEEESSRRKLSKNGRC